ncbi:MAG TPA: UbiX family flavin prenyltransferase [Campylobacteraceae bacterium]|nr:UbiX family flavin prenyltransferase [Campylobacteraceae bacterium]
MRLIVAITGASGVRLGKRFVEALPDAIEKQLILSQNARTVFEKEHHVANLHILDNDDIAAPVASGSFKCDAMAVIPTSMNTLAKIACGIADNLTTRAAAVQIKEQRKLLLAPREMPFSPVALENMLKLARLQIIIAPPVPGYYASIGTLEQMEDFMIGKWFDLLGIEHRLFQRWGET